MEARDTQFFHAGVNFAQRQAEQEKKAIEARSAFLAKLAQKDNKIVIGLFMIIN